MTGATAAETKAEVVNYLVQCGKGDGGMIERHMCGVLGTGFGIQ